MTEDTFDWVDTDKGFEEVLADAREAEAVALDTEFHRERTYFPNVALVQLAWPGHPVVLIDALAVDLAPLASILDGPAIVMHAGAQDLEVLLRCCNRLPAKLFDTQLAAGFVGWNGASLATLVAGALGVRLPKGDRLADWLRRPLTLEQQTYAASDVAHLLAVRDELLERLDARGRRTWAEAECDELLRRAGTGRNPEEAWWRVKEARSLRGRSIGVAQAVGAWRELRAAAVDQPIRFVLPDLALIGIAQRPPTDIEGLQRIRGLDGRHVRGPAARDLLAAIRRGLELAPDQLRLPPAGDVDRELRPAVTLASAWISQLGRDLQIDPSLLATRADIEALVRGDEDARLLTGWRADAIGEAVRRLLDGDAALAFDGRGGLVLEERSGRKLL